MLECYILLHPVAMCIKMRTLFWFLSLRVEMVFLRNPGIRDWIHPDFLLATLQVGFQAGILSLELSNFKISQPPTLEFYIQPCQCSIFVL